MSKKSFTIGSDPEFFILDHTGKYPVKASTVTPGTKDDVEDLKEGYNVHADNVMLELNIPPASSREGFVNNILLGKKKLQNLIQPNQLITIPSFNFPKDVLTDEKDWEIGCEPDNNAYTMDNNPTIKLKDGMRYAGGHVHIGLPEEMTDFVTVINIVKALDFLFMDMVVKKDTDLRRRKVYGTPGRFRFKDYGLEYRSLSNFWLRRVSTIKQVYDIVEEAVNNYEKYISKSHEEKVFLFFQTTEVKQNEIEKNTGIIQKVPVKTL